MLRARLLAAALRGLRHLRAQVVDGRAQMRGIRLEFGGAEVELRTDLRHGIGAGTESCDESTAQGRRPALSFGGRGLAEGALAGDTRRVRVGAAEAAILLKRGHHGAVAFVAIAAGANVQDG
jgi:hypothetical protein